MRKTIRYRRMAIWNVLRGRPTIYGVWFEPSKMIARIDVNPHLHVISCRVEAVEATP